MTTMLLLLLSGVLIGTGVSLIWRDVHNKRRDAFVLSRDPKIDPQAEPDVEIAVSRPAASAPLCSPHPPRRRHRGERSAANCSRSPRASRPLLTNRNPAGNRCCAPMQHAPRRRRNSGRRCSRWSAPRWSR